MMKNIFISLYILLVLGFSGFAKASVLEIDKASYDANLFKLSLSGQIYGVCNPKLSLEVSETMSLVGDNATVVVLSLKNAFTNSPCSAPLSQATSFDMITDIRTFNLPAGQKYIIKFADNIPSAVSFEVTIPHNQVFLQIDTKALLGTLVALSDGSFALVTGANSMLVVESQMDLYKYAGQLVRIEGIELLHQVGPIVEGTVLDPLRAGTKTVKPSLFVMSINSVNR